MTQVGDTQRMNFKPDGSTPEGQTVKNYMESGQGKALDGRSGDGKASSGGADAKAEVAGKPEARAGEKPEVRSAERQEAKAGEKPREGTDKTKDASDNPEKLAGEKAVKAMTETLQKGGMSEKDARETSQQIHDRLTRVKEGREPGDGKADERLKGTPAEQMERTRQAYEKILKPGETFAGYNDRQKQDVVQDLASRMADPDKFVNQGGKNTCALEALQKQRLESGDPAQVAEQTASLIQTGGADVTGNDGKTMRVNVAKESLQPDKESAAPFDKDLHGAEGGKRGLGGQAMDALYGQQHSDLMSMRKGQPTSADGIDKAGTVYLTANAQKPPYNAPTGRGQTGEGSFDRQPDGSLQFKDSSPRINAFDREWLNQRTGGKEGSIFVHENAAGSGVPDPRMGYPDSVRLNTFKNPQDLHNKISQWEKDTGSSAQLMINANFMEGQSLKGHSIHAMTVKATQIENADGTKSIGFKMDNQNGKNFDRVSTAQAVDLSTNNKYWGDKPQAQQPGRPAGGDNQPQPQSQPGREAPGGRDNPSTPGGRDAGGRPAGEDAYRYHRPDENSRQLGEKPLDPKLDDKLKGKEGDDKDKARKIDPAVQVKALGAYQKAMAQYEEAAAKAKASGSEYKGTKPDFYSILSSFE